MLLLYILIGFPVPFLCLVQYSHWYASIFIILPRPRFICSALYNLLYTSRTKQLYASNKNPIVSLMFCSRPMQAHNICKLLSLLGLSYACKARKPVDLPGQDCHTSRIYLRLQYVFSFLVFSNQTLLCKISYISSLPSGSGWRKPLSKSVYRHSQPPLLF